MKRQVRRKCTVLRFTASPCSQRKKYSDDLHIQSGESLRLLCAGCCPACVPGTTVREPV